MRGGNDGYSTGNTVGLTHTLPPLLSGRRKLLIGMSGQGTDVYVPETLLEEARNICEAEEIE